MTVKISAAVAALMVKAAAEAPDAGSTGGTLTVYSGVQPASPAEAVTTQTELVIFQLPKPVFLPPVDQPTMVVAVANPVTAVEAIATDTATWFRITDSDGAPVLDGDVTDTTGAGSLTISSTAIVETVEVSVVSLTFAMLKA